MANVRVLRQPALECQAQVDAFYARNGAQGRARPGDLFFCAYVGDELVGCVRYCVEFQTPMLRTMMIDEKYRRTGLGKQILEEFAKFLDENLIHNVYALPYTHLESFYSEIGFKRVDPDFAPDFLYQRLTAYNGPGDVKMICMKRN